GAGNRPGIGDRRPHRARARRPPRGREFPRTGHDCTRATPPGELMTPNILVVDDDAVTCRLLSEVLTRDGATVLCETDPHGAWGRLSKNPVGVAILDVRMPGRDGLELLRGLRERVPNLPIIIMTAFGSIDTAVQAISAGAVDYVSKPMNLEEIRATVHKA